MAIAQNVAFDDVDMPTKRPISGANSHVWKFHDFSITEILRENNFRNSRGAKFAILTHLEALICDFYEFLHFLKSEIDQVNKIKSP